jgi:Mg/Co/Ni transporter MgtE
MTEPAYLSRHLLVGDALALMEHSVSAVVEAGELIGVVAREALVEADPAARVEDLMDDPVFLEVGDAYEEAARLNGLFRGAPIPVIDARGQLVGCVVAPT